MKISKTRLKEIIKEELGGLRESVESNAALAAISAQLGAPPSFAAAVSEAIMIATATPDSLGGDDAVMAMVDALQLLLGDPGEEVVHQDDDDEVDALVLPRLDYDPLSDDPRAEKMRDIARRKR